MALKDKVKGLVLPAVAGIAALTGSCSTTRYQDSSGRWIETSSFNLNGISAFGKGWGGSINGGGGCYGGYGSPVYGGGGWGGNGGGGAFGGMYPGEARTTIVRDAYGRWVNGPTAVDQRPVGVVSWQASKDIVEIKDAAGQTWAIDKAGLKGLNEADISVYTDDKTNQSVALPKEIYEGLNTGQFCVAYDENNIIAVMPGTFKEAFDTGVAKVWRGKNAVPTAVPAKVFDDLQAGKASLTQTSKGFKFVPRVSVTRASGHQGR